LDFGGGVSSMMSASFSLGWKELDFVEVEEL